MVGSHHSGGKHFRADYDVLRKNGERHAYIVYCTASNSDMYTAFSMVARIYWHRLKRCLNLRSHFTISTTIRDAKNI
jgi:hypothetical protein